MTARWTVLVAVVWLSACGGSPSPVMPSPLPSQPTPPAPVAVSAISVTPCPPAILGFAVDLAFYTQIGCNSFDGPPQPVRRWTRAPSLYLRTIDEAGAAIDPVTLDTVAAAMINTASSLTGGRFGLAGLERGTDTRAGVSGWITVTWLAAPSTSTVCGVNYAGTDSGLITFNYKTPGCSCNGSAIRPRTAKHELGHAFGYWHTDNANDLMSIIGQKPCDQALSARESQAIAYQYRD